MPKNENKKEVEVLEEKTKKEKHDTPIKKTKEKIEQKESKESKETKNKDSAPKESKSKKEESKNNTTKEKENDTKEKIKETLKGNTNIKQTEEEIALTKELDEVLKELRKEIKKEDSKEEKEENMAKKKKKKKNSKTKKALKKPINIIGLILGILFLVSTLLVFGIVTYVNILPTKFYTIFAVVFGIFILLVSFMLLNVKVKKGLKKTFMGIGLITTIICTIASYYAFHTFGFLQKITNADMSTKEKYYVMVKSDSKYVSLSEIKGFSLGTFNENTNIYKDALDKLNKKVEVTLVETESSIETIEWLLNDEVSVILLSNLHKEQYEEDHEKLDDKVKILETIEVKSDHSETEVVAIKPVSDDVMTIYISGIDTYGTINLRSRSDVNMLATINTKNHEILLTSIPRDYYVQLHDKPGYKDKLTHAGIYGVNTSIQTIQDFMGIEINYYVRVNFSTLEQVVNAIGGIDVYSDKSFVPYTNRSLYIKQGMVHMDGKTALAFARERYAYESGDRHRVQNQQDVLKAIINKATTDPSILTKYTTLLNSVSGYFQTNVDMTEISEIVKIQLDKMPSWTIKQYSLDGTGSKQPTYSMGNTPLYVMMPNEETIVLGSKYINGMTKGKTFTELGLTQ